MNLRLFGSEVYLGEFQGRLDFGRSGLRRFFRGQFDTAMQRGLNVTTFAPNLTSTDNIFRPFLSNRSSGKREKKIPDF